jgi:hypothetical protein
MNYGYIDAVQAGNKREAGKRKTSEEQNRRKQRV